MPQRPEKKLSKRASKRMEGDAAGSRPASNLRPLSMSTPMQSWPLFECLVPEEWQTPGALVELIVARRSDAGEFAVALFLVDLGCLGVKNAHTMRFTDETEYREWLDTVPTIGAMVPISLDLAAKIVRTAVDYASSLGFRPHRDYSQASPFLRGAEPSAASEDVPTGRDGKPLFISGPFDNVRKIIQQLDRKVGEGNYTVMLADDAIDQTIADNLMISDEPERLP